MFLLPLIAPSKVWVIPSSKVISVAVGVPLWWRALPMKFGCLLGPYTGPTVGNQ